MALGAADRHSARHLAAGAHSIRSTIRWAIVVLASAMLALLVSGWRYRGKPTRAAHLRGRRLCRRVQRRRAGRRAGGRSPTGSAARAAPAIVRANIILYFAISTVIAMVSYFAGGVLTLTVLKLALVVGPVYGLGLFIGSRLFGVADEGVFRRICYALIAVAVLVSLPVLDGVVR